MIDKAIESDREVKKTGESDLEEKLITVYGDVQLTSQERKFLSLGPYFPLMENLDRETAAQDFLTAITKVRWERMGLES